MKTVSLSGSLRENVGKKGAADLRRNGRVPCVLYGGEEQLHFHISVIDLKKMVFNPDVYRVNLDVDGKQIDGVIQDIQWHPVNDSFLHVDFLQLTDDKEVKIKMPVSLEGNSVGVRNGGKLSQNFRHLTLAGLPKDFPDAVSLDISGLDIGASIRVRDIEYPGLTILEPTDAVVVAVKTARGAVVSDEEKEAVAEEA